MQKIQKQVEKLNDENYFANFISVEEDERKIRNTYFANGKEEGEKRGEKRGKADGIKIGEKLGEKRGKENALIETAKRLLSLGLSVKEVAKGTGLTENKVRTLL